MNFLPSSFPISSYILPNENRSYFKDVLGQLLKSEEDIEIALSDIKKDTSIPKIVTVGDETTLKLMKYSIIPDLAIIDGKTERKKSVSVDMSYFKVFDAINPPGEITKEAWEKIREALNVDSIKIIIKISGEEDLLVLPAIIEVSANSKVLYGQPKEGLVLITVTEERKKFVINLMQQKMVKKNGNRNPK